MKWAAVPLCVSSSEVGKPGGGELAGDGADGKTGPSFIAQLMN